MEQRQPERLAAESAAFDTRSRSELMRTQQSAREAKEPARAGPAGVTLRPSGPGPAALPAVTARFLSLQSHAGNGAVARMVQRWGKESAEPDRTQRTPAAPTPVKQAVMQRITYEKGYGPASWEGWIGPWRDEAAEVLWAEISSRYDSLRIRLALLEPEAVGWEKEEIAYVAAALDALESSPISFQAGDRTRRALEGHADLVEVVEAWITLRKRRAGLAEEVEELTKKSRLAEHCLAAAVLSCAIAYETYRARQGAQPRGRGAHAAAEISEIDRAYFELLERLETGRDLVRKQIDVGTDVLGAIRRPGRAGILAGIDPWPMPVAKVYAAPHEVRDALFKVLFLVTATPAETQEYLSRVGSFAVGQSARPIGGGSQHMGGEPSARVPQAPIDYVLGKRNLGVGGFAVGVGIGMHTVGQLPILRDPVMQFQTVWDAYHVLNDVAVKTRDVQRPVLRYAVSLQVALGRAKARGLLAVGSALAGAAVGLAGGASRTETQPAVPTEGRAPEAGPPGPPALEPW